MFFTEKRITIKKRSSKIDSPIVLYRGDKNIEVRFSINNNPFTNTSQNIYGQLIMHLPNTDITLFSNVNAFINDIVKFILPEDIMDDIVEVGTYNLQLRLFNEDKTSVITIPAIEKGLDIREPIAIEGQSGQPIISYNPITTTITIDLSIMSYNDVTKSITADGVSYNESTKTINI